MKLQVILFTNRNGKKKIDKEKTTTTMASFVSLQNT